MRKGVLFIVVITTLMISSTFMSAATIIIPNEETSFYWTRFNSNDADVPTWNIGDMWIYELNIEGGHDPDVEFQVLIPDMEFTVEDSEDDTAYKIHCTGSFTGSGSFWNVLSGNIQDGILNGYVYVNKSDLSVKKVEINADGYIKPLVGRIQFSVDGNVNLTPIVPTLDFPMNVNESWLVPEIIMLLDLSGEIAGIFDGDMFLQLYVKEHGLNCLRWETLTVGGVEYDALKISGDVGRQHDIWYSPRAGSVIKLDIRDMNIYWSEDYFYTINKLEMMLKSTTFQAPTNPPDTPSIPDGPTLLTAGDSGAYSSSAIDPDGDKIKYIFDWGDGTETQTSFYESGVIVTVSHQWISGGSHSVRVKARDKFGAESGWSSILNVTVLNTKPETPSPPEGPSSGKVRRSYTYTTSTIDPDGHNVRYLFDWGDGSTSWTDLYSSGDSASASYTWRSQGSYSIRVKAQDEYGAESNWSEPLSVSMPKNKQIFISVVQVFLEKFIERFPVVEQLFSLQIFEYL